MPKCCGRWTDYGKFCSECGKKQEDTAPKYIGKYKERGIYRIIFAPVEGKFDGEDSVRDAARHSAWDTDSKFESFTIEKVKTTVPKEKYPYICKCGNTVSKTTDGLCYDCGEQDWKTRL